MKRLILLCCLLLCSLTTTVAAETPDIATTIFQAQSLPNMQNGIYAIPEDILNTYFTATLADNPKVKDSNITIHKNNKLTLTTTVEKTGTLRLNCTIKEFHFDKDDALLKLQIDKKELVGNSIGSWLMNQISLGMIADIYGNPLAQANIDSKIKGNTIDINLKPFATTLFNTGIGQAIGDKLSVSNVSTDDKIIYLHTNVAIGLIK